MHQAIEGGARDPVASRQLLAVGGRDGELRLESGNFFCRQLQPRAELHASRLGAGNTLGSTLLDEVALEFTDGGQHVEQQTACGASGIDGLVEDHEVYLLGSDLRRDLG